LRAVRAIAAAVPEAIVGVGTVLSAEHIAAAVEAGAKFGVSPGHTSKLLDAAEAAGFPFLPGASTASEVMALLERGYTRQKLFPAEAVGGMALLKGLAEPLPQVRFCPTGGIDAAKAPAYLALRNVACVGGSWVAPKDAVATADTSRIESLASAAAALRST
jgi:2-dehydro-3-deoxyphosphogluconate aldolase/(4S)-4-hydroxy-2-oxoglutarate aldolase